MPKELYHSIRTSHATTLAISSAWSVCAGCGERRPRAEFGGSATPSRWCDVCRSDQHHSRPWSEKESDLLYAAARRVCDLFNDRIDEWSEDERVRWVDLISALDRRELPEGGHERLAPMGAFRLEQRNRWHGTGANADVE